MKKIIALIILLVIVTCLFTGCQTKDYYTAMKYYNTTMEYYNIAMNKGMEFGFDVSSSGGEPSYPLRCAYRTDKRVFDIDEVTVDFYYGGSYQDVESLLKGAYNIPGFKIVITDLDRLAKNEYVYERYVDENFVSEKYNCELVRDRVSRVTEYKFNYSESIKLPKELFDKESGRIDFIIFGTNIKSPEPSETVIVRTGFYYKIINGKVCLSVYELKF